MEVSLHAILYLSLFHVFLLLNLKLEEKSTKEDFKIIFGTLWMNLLLLSVSVVFKYSRHPILTWQLWTLNYFYTEKSLVKPLAKHVELLR